MKHHLFELANSIKVGLATGATTTAIGLSVTEKVPDEFKLFGWIPEDIGNLAALLGVILTTVIIFVQGNNWLNGWRNGRLETKKRKLEIRKLEKELNSESPPKPANED